MKFSSKSPGSRSRSGPQRRVEERLVHDLLRALPEPSPELAPRILAALRAGAPSSVVEARSPRPRRVAIVLAGAAAALLIAMALSRERAEPPTSLPPAQPIVTPSLPLRPPSRAIEQFFRAPDNTRWARVLDEPLQREARLIAHDGELVARAFLAGLPRPLRSALER